MAKKLRRTVSMKQALYDKLTEYCRAQGIPRAYLLEKLLHVELKLHPPVRHPRVPPNHAAVGSGERVVAQKRLLREEMRMTPEAVARALASMRRKVG